MLRQRSAKTIDEIEHNKSCIKKQIENVVKSENLRMVDNFDWFKDMNYLSFLREVGKTFSMTQLLDRQFVQNRIGEGGSGISYAEFSYTLIQGYDFLHLYREYGIDLQLCGADQTGNCTSGIHMIKRLENAKADLWSTPLVIDRDGEGDLAILLHGLGRELTLAVAEGGIREAVTESVERLALEVTVGTVLHAVVEEVRKIIVRLIEGHRELARWVVVAEEYLGQSLRATLTWIPGLEECIELTLDATEGDARA